MAMTAWFPTKAAREIVARIEITHTRNLGRTPILMPLLSMLGLRQAIDKRQTLKEDRVLSDGEVLEALAAHIVNSIGGKRVPLYKLDGWMQKSGLASFYDVDAAYFNDDRFDRALDRFLPHSREVLIEVSMNLLGQFHPVVGALHHDLTYVMLSGEYEGSSLITYGYNSKGVEQKQVNVELDVLGPEGLVVYGAPIAGRENGCNSFAETVGITTALLGGSGRTIVSDRMFADYLRLWGLKAHGHHFICPLDSNLLPPGFIENIPEEEFEVVDYQSEHDPENIYRAAHRPLTLKAPRGVSTPPLKVEALIVHSERKAKDDRQGREKALLKIEKRLEEIKGHLNQRRYAQREFAQEQIKKALKPPFGKYVVVELTGENKQLELEFWRNEALLQEREKVDGKYVLVTDFIDPEAMSELLIDSRVQQGMVQQGMVQQGMVQQAVAQPNESRERLWRERVLRLHKEQHLVESRNRNLKTDLVLNPVWLKKETRIKALLNLYIIAVMLYSLIEVLYRRSTAERWTARRVLEEFGEYYAHRVKVAGEGAAWVLSEPCAEQRRLLRCLGLEMPAATFARL